MTEGLCGHNIFLFAPCAFCRAVQAAVRDTPWGSPPAFRFLARRRLALRIARGWNPGPGAAARDQGVDRAPSRGMIFFGCGGRAWREHVLLKPVGSGRAICARRGPT